MSITKLIMLIRQKRIEDMPILFSTAESFPSNKQCDDASSLMLITLLSGEGCAFCNLTCKSGQRITQTDTEAAVVVI